MVAGIQNGSPAERAGIQRGDVILEMNRQPVHSVEEARQFVAKAGEKDPLLLLVKRDRGNLFIALTL